MKHLLVLAACFLATPAGAATYFAKVNQDGSIANLVVGTSDNMPVPASCPGCTIVTQQQFATYSAQYSAANAHSYISRSDFWARFTPTEQAAIAAASRTNDTINLWLITAQAATNIDLTDPKTSQGLDILVSAGIIDATRKAALLTAP